MPADVAGRRRVFFALWPDPAATERLDQLGRQAQSFCGGRRMQRNSLHMTLVFVGEVPVDRIEVLQHAAADIRVPDFSLRLDRLACWRHNRIVWAGCEQAPLPLLLLVGQLAEKLEAAGLPLDVRDFMAHVTLLRDARCEALPACEPIAWPVNEFVLAASNPAAGNGGARYDIVGLWPLVPAA